VGDPAPPFALPGPHGETQTLDALCAGGRPVILLFVDPANQGSRRLVRDVADVLRRRASAVTVAAVASGLPGDGRYEDDLRTIPLLADTDGGVAEAYGVSAVPAAVLVGSDGAIGSSVAVGTTTIRRLVDLAAAFPRAYPAIGQQTDQTAHRPNDPCLGCLEICQRRGGGNACAVVCRAAGACAQSGPSGR
jgi:peroxiredoxin